MAAASLVLDVGCRSPGAGGTGTRRGSARPGWVTLATSGGSTDTGTVTLTSGGVVFETTVDHGSVSSRMGRLPCDVVDALLSEIWDSTFLVLEDSYRMDINDGRETTITIVRGGIAKTVTSYGLIGLPDVIKTEFPGIVKVDMDPYMEIEGCADLIRLRVLEVEWH